MHGWKLLKHYYNIENNESLSLLTDSKSLRGLQQEATLILFVRYLQNLYEIEVDSLFKTLFLSASLLKINSSKMRRMFPFNSISLPALKKSIKFQNHQAQILQRIVDYLNLLIANDQSQVPLERQLEVLTKNIMNISHIIDYKGANEAKYAKSYYWMVEQRLYQLWLSISKDLIDQELLDNEKFTHFYEKYTLFCQYKRKIPKGKHKNLKSIEITSETNKRIMDKYHEILAQENKKENASKEILQTNERDSKMNKMLKMMSDFDSDDD